MLSKYFINSTNPAKLMMVGDGPEKKKQNICQELGILTK
jgi:hypothetical protein